MKVQAKHGKVTQNMHGASRNYRYVWDVSCPKLSPLGSPIPDYNRCIQLMDRIKNTTNSINKRVIRSENMALRPKVTSIKSNKLQQR